MSNPNSNCPHYELLAGLWGECAAVKGAQQPVRLLLDLARCLSGPFAVLYLLAEPHGSYPPARYQ